MALALGPLAVRGLAGIVVIAVIDAGALGDPTDFRDAALAVKLPHSIGLLCPATSLSAMTGSRPSSSHRPEHPTPDWTDE
jgi:hypothetical protein